MNKYEELRAAMNREDRLTGQGNEATRLLKMLAEDWVDIASANADTKTRYLSIGRRCYDDASKKLLTQ